MYKFAWIESSASIAIIRSTNMMLLYEEKKSGGVQGLTLTQEITVQSGRVTHCARTISAFTTAMSVNNTALEKTCHKMGHVLYEILHCRRR